MRLVPLDPAPVLIASAILTPLGLGIEAVARAEEADALGPRLVDLDLAALSGEAPLRFRRMDRYSALGFAAARVALRAAGLAPLPEGDPDWGVLVGSSTACWSSNAAFFLALTGGSSSELSPALFARTVANAVNGEISIACRIGGVNETYVSGWTAGAEAIAQSGALLSSGRARFVLAGGVEAHDATVERMQSGWLPASVAESAALLLFASAETAGTAGRLRLRAIGHAREARRAFSLQALLETCEPSITSVLVANTVPAELAARFEHERGGARLLFLPRHTGELGAAGAAVAVALAEQRSRAAHPSAGATLLLARGVEGNLVALLLTLDAGP